MPIEILMPALSPTMEQGSLTKWLVKEGDIVASGDLLAEIETDKATMEFEAVDEGVIGKILIPEGSQDVAVNTPIAILLDEGETADGPDQPAPAPTSAVTPQAEAPSDNKQATAEQTTPATASAAPFRQPNAQADRVFATPLARIVKADVENADPAAKSAAAALTAPTAPALATSADSETVKKMYTDREYEEIPLDGMRKIIASRLTEAKQTIPHFYLRRDIGLDKLLRVRGEINKGLEARGVKTSMNDFIIKACALGLQKVPTANAVWAGDRVLQMEASDISVAVAIEGGLFTPVLQDAEAKPLSQLAVEMKDLAARARNRKLAPHEYQGGSFAISNLGMFGIENFDAVINPPHGSILAVGAGQKQPIVNSDGALAAATMMSVTLSVDHRVIDGALGAQFLAALAGYIEKPMSMLV